MVHQSFHPLSGSQLRDVSMEGDLFKPNVSCEIANVTTFRRESSLLQSLDLSGGLVAQLECPTCSVGAEGRMPPGFVGVLSIDTTTKNVSEDCVGNCSSWLVSHLFLANCSRSHEPSLANGSSAMPLNTETPWDLRFALLVVNFTLGPSLLVPNPETSSSDSHVVISNPQVQQSAAVICNVDYSMHKSMVHNDLASGSISIASQAPATKFNSLTGTMLGQILYTSLYNFQNNKKGKQTGPSFYELLLKTLPGQQSMDRFLVAETLQSSAVQVWAGLMAHFIRENVLTPASIEKIATSAHSEDRLVVGRIALWLMTTGFVIMAAITFCVLLTAHRDLVPQDIGMVSTDGMILAASRRLRALLKDSGELGFVQLTNSLDGYGFATTFDGRFSIQVTDKKAPEERCDPMTRAKPWTPLAAKYPLILLTVVMPLIAMILLEVLYRMSEASAGLMDVSGSEDVASYISRHVSAAALLLIATCFSGFDFTVALFLPYSRLRSGPLPAPGGMELHTLGRTPPHAMWLSLRYRDFGSFFAKFAAIIGSLLTIVSSGLWTIDRDVAVQQSIQASAANTWDLEWFNSSSTGDSGAGVLFDDIQHGAAIPPASIWGEIVLPDVADIKPLSATPATFELGRSQKQNYTLQVSALRPFLDCEVIADEYVLMYTLIPDRVGVKASPPLPLGCRHAGPAGNESSYEFSTELTHRSRVRGSSDAGSFADLHLGPWNQSFTGLDDFGESQYNLQYQRDNPAGCPSIGVIFARVINSTTNNDNATALLCSQMIQQVQLNITYTGSDLVNPKISVDRPPVLIDNLTRNLTNGTKDIDTFPYRVQVYLTSVVGNLTSIEHNISTVQYHQNLAPFMEHLVWGPNGTAADALVGRENRLVLKKAVQDLYARYMRHVIDMRFRQPIIRDKRSEGSVVDDVVITGTAESFTSRLQLDRPSKLALQIMLGTMTLLGILAFMLTDLRGTLPRQPSSIASRMALLSGSDLCREYARDRRLDPTAEGWLFSLGWWRLSDENAEQVERSTSDDHNSARGEEEPRARRFGIDIGVPEQLGFRETKWWTLRRRLGARILRRRD